MPVDVVALVLLSALAHAAWNALVKSSRDPENAIVGMMLVGGLTGLTIAVATRAALPGPSALFWIVVSGILEAVYFVLLARALSRAPLGAVYTIVRGGGLVVLWPASVLLLGERITLGHFVGTVFVLAGLTATGASGTRPASGSIAEAARTRARSGLVAAACCALFVGGYQLAYKIALSKGGSPAIVNGVSLCIGSTLSLLARFGDRGHVLAAVRRERWRTLVGGLLGSIGFLLFLLAMRNAGAGSVATLRNTSILFAQGMAVALGERPKKLALAGALAVTIGAVALARG